MSDKGKPEKPEKPEKLSFDNVAPLTPRVTTESFSSNINVKNLLNESKSNKKGS